mmetsp:Transcript_25870/g.65068  ORF Transcript_25870/g.65068 Transcript_25870/m.65068 type:complete len:378 (+) Transcript_25870:217-1350(+)
MSSRHRSRSSGSRRKSTARRSIMASISVLQSSEKAGSLRFSSRQSLACTWPGLTLAQNFFLSPRQVRKIFRLRRRSSAFSTSWRNSSSWQSQLSWARLPRRQSCTRPPPGSTVEQSVSASPTHSSYSMASLRKSSAPSIMVRNTSLAQAWLISSLTSRRQVSTAPGSGIRYSFVQYLATSMSQLVASGRSLLMLVERSALNSASSSLQSSDSAALSPPPLSSSRSWPVRQSEIRPPPGVISTQKASISVAQAPVVETSPSPALSAAGGASLIISDVTTSGASSRYSCASAASAICSASSAPSAASVTAGPPPSADRASSASSALAVTRLPRLMMPKPQKPRVSPAQKNVSSWRAPSCVQWVRAARSDLSCAQQTALL